MCLTSCFLHFGLQFLKCALNQIPTFGWCFISTPSCPRHCWLLLVWWGLKEKNNKKLNDQSVSKNLLTTREISETNESSNHLLEWQVLFNKKFKNQNKTPLICLHCEHQRWVTRIVGVRMLMKSHGCKLQQLTCVTDGPIKFYFEENLICSLSFFLGSSMKTLHH